MILKGPELTSKRIIYGMPFYLTVAYLALEYGRPQETIPGLDALRLPGIVVILLILALVKSQGLNLGARQTKLFIFFLMLMTIHIPFAVNNYWAFQTTRQMVLIFVGYLAIVTFIDSLQKFRTMISVWMSIHIYLAITGIMRGGQGIGGFLTDENDFSLALNMVIPFSFFLALAAETNIKRIFYLILTGVFLASNVSTLSRGGFVGLLTVGFYCWLRSPRKILSTVVIVLLAYGLLHFAPETYWLEMQTILDEPHNAEGTGQARVYSWTAAWKMFLDYPILGVGPENFPWNFEKYEPPEGFGGVLHGGRAAHSLYFTLLPELGIIGTMTFAWISFSSLMDLRHVTPGRSERPYKYFEDATGSQLKCVRLALEASMLGFLASGTFLSVLYYPCFWIWMAMVVSLKRAV